MKLIRVSSALVDRYSKEYNSNFHTELEAPNLPIPSETPQSFTRWLPLIAFSQNIPTTSIQTISLTPPQTQLLLDASQASLHTRETNRLYTEDLTDLTSAFASLHFPPEGLFLRLDECSPKDGKKGTSPLRTAEEIILRLTTSHRATNAMIRQKEKHGSGPVKLIFLPYDPKMNTAKEFRVFCAPPTGRITAVSQYKWHEPSAFRGRTPTGLDRFVKRVMDEILHVHEEIMSEAAKGDGGEIDKLLLEQGFTFDVTYDEEQRKCSLIELNSFGARSGCGSCLFHWLTDMKILYGTQVGDECVENGDTHEVEFRISI